MIEASLRDGVRRVLLGVCGLSAALGCSETVVDAIVPADAFDTAEDDGGDGAGGCRLGASDDCAADERCEVDGCGTVAGRCTPVTDVCDATWDPQCGCDGRTYWNTCELLRAGVARLHAEACAETECGPYPGGACPPGLLCAAVGCLPGTQGVCAVPPASCGTDRAPACACNGASFPDVCELFRDPRLPMDHAGDCDPPPCAPECRDTGDGTFAWLDPCEERNLCFADCSGCSSYCGGMGAPDEGWYASCPVGRDAGCVAWNVIEWTPCGRR